VKKHRPDQKSDPGPLGYIVQLINCTGKKKSKNNHTYLPFVSAIVNVTYHVICDEAQGLLKEITLQLTSK
jgi:hypothetical protein